MSTVAVVKKCTICGIARTKIIDRAHIIPRHLVLGLRNYRKYAGYEGKNIVLLCRNHHTLFDAVDLLPAEWAKVIPSIKVMEPVILELLNSRIHFHKKKMNFLEKREHANRVAAHDRWCIRFGAKLVALDIIEYHGTAK